MDNPKFKLITPKKYHNLLSYFILMNRKSDDSKNITSLLKFLETLFRKIKYVDIHRLNKQENVELFDYSILINEFNSNFNINVSPLFCKHLINFFFSINYNYIDKFMSYVIYDVDDITTNTSVNISNFSNMDYYLNSFVVSFINGDLKMAHKYYQLYEKLLNKYNNENIQNTGYNKYSVTFRLHTTGISYAPNFYVGFLETFLTLLRFPQYMTR